MGINSLQKRACRRVGMQLKKLSLIRTYLLPPLEFKVCYVILFILFYDLPASVERSTLSATSPVKGKREKDAIPTKQAKTSKTEPSPLVESMISFVRCCY